jgi:uncharacterized membrane protein YccC
VKLSRLEGFVIARRNPVSPIHAVRTAVGVGFLSFGLSVLAVGILCWAFRVEQSAYRYAGITVAIVMLAGHSESAWTVALHRFTEVSLGISVALVFAIGWPDRPSAPLQR